MKITVIGCGRWGSFIAYYLDKIGHDVTVYGLADAPEMIRFLKERRNDLLELSDTTKLSTDKSVIADAETIVISIGCQGLRSLMAELSELSLKNKKFVLCMKGIEISTGMRLSEIVRENTDPSNRIAVWLGPGHVQEFCRGVPNCMVIDSDDEELKIELVKAFSSKLIRFYYGTDLIGSEIGGAAKNVLGIAAGMLDGFSMTTLKGALMSRGTREIARLMKAMGGNELSAYGLCLLGDYEATLFSKHSHNRAFGELFVRGERFGALAEGYYTVKALMVLKERYSVDLPICTAVYDILYNGADSKEELTSLFSRSLKWELE
ncbi:MAG: glycerol-3-phosphate dehydrogenase [Clostridia bacterium]|nr:glycerol-3-phosphate dehydrogenase [Clostridia bacterium]